MTTKFIELAKFYIYTIR